MACRFCNYDFNTVLLESKHWQVIPDLYPASEGHVLIIPKKHYEVLHEVPKEELSDGMELVKKCQLILLKEFNAKGIVFRNNYLPFVEENTHVVRHLHFHFIPLYGHGEYKEVLNRTDLTKEKIDRLKNAFKNFDKQARL